MCFDSGVSKTPDKPMAYALHSEYTICCGYPLKLTKRLLSNLAKRVLWRLGQVFKNPEGQTHTLFCRNEKTASGMRITDPKSGSACPALILSGNYSSCYVVKFIATPLLLP
jgi:hypothetical protein